MTDDPADYHDIPGVPDSVIENMLARSGGFPVPSGPIYPGNEPNEVLETYGLPPRPDDNADPKLQEVWRYTFGDQTTLEPFVLDVERMKRTVFRPLVRRAEAASVGETRMETSSNWSGAYITANRDRQFMQVWGSWTIPDNLKLPPPGLTGPADLGYMCANWIGLDGQRLYLDSSLPQIGTSSMLLADGTTVASSWTQWWARNDASTAPAPLGLMVDPGNEVACVVTAWDPQTVHCVMVNRSSHTTMAAWISSPPVKLPDNSTTHPDIAGATAEWILERPAIVGQPNRYDFPDYGESRFHHCIAVESGRVNILALFSGIRQELQGERLIRMFDVRRNPARTACISLPKKLNDRSVHLKYGSFYPP